MTQEHQILWQRFCRVLVPSRRDLAERAALCRRWWPEETARSLETAGQLLENTFLFQHPWDMEQTQVPVHFENRIQWDAKAAGDPEFTYQLCRQRYLICLGQSYVLTGEDRYAQCFVRLLLDFCRQQPWRAEAADTTWRTLDTGLRASYWVRTMALCAASPAVTEQVAEQFLQGLEIHAQRLASNPRTVFSRKSNWGVMEYAGLYLLGHLLDREAYLALSRQYLHDALHIQILPDGMHWEASPMYHNEVLMALLEAMRIAALFGDALFSPEEEKIVERMAMATLLLKTPAHHQPMVGDSDDTDVRDILSQAALQFQNGTLKAGGYARLDYESLWLFGAQGAAAYDRLSPCPLPAGPVVLEASGQAVLRSSWEPGASFLYFRNGPLGGGHGHCDRLHLGLWMDGEEILVDPGRYTYTDSETRYYLKSAAAHNVPLAGSGEYASSLDSWSYCALPVSFPNRLVQEDGFILLEGAHAGYASQGITVGRRILVLGQDAVVICDDFLGPQPGPGRQMFHFSEQICLEPVQFHLSGQGKRCRFEMHSFSSGAPLCPTLAPGVLSRHYNQLTAAQTASVGAECVRSLTTILVRAGGFLRIQPLPVENALHGKPLDPNQAEGYAIDVGTHQYRVALLHQDVGNSLDFNGLSGVYGLGRAMACDLARNPSVMTVLQR